jgi:hypothetical protein
MVAKIQRPAAMRQPAHNDLVRCNHLLAIDAQVLPRLVWPARNHQTPRNQRRNIARPAMLDRQLAQIHVLAFPYNFLTRRRRQHLGRHGEYLLQDGPFLPRIFQSLGRFRFFQVGQQLADIAQRADTLLAHAQRHAARCAKQVGQHRHLVPDHVLEQHRRTLRTQYAVAYFGHFQMGGNGGCDAFEFADFLQLGDEVAQVVVFHFL